MTVREALKARLERARGKKTRLLAEVAAVQAEIDSLKALAESLTAEHDTLLANLCVLGVLKTED